jgi:RHS repeat-associated protein
VTVAVVLAVIVSGLQVLMPTGGGDDADGRGVGLTGLVSALAPVAASADEATDPGSATGSYVPVSPLRIGAATLTAGTGSQTVQVQVAGLGGVPASGAAAAVLHVEMLTPSATGYVTVFPWGETRPAVSQVNVRPGVTVGNTVIAKLGAGGAVAVYLSAGTADLRLDVLGYYTDGSAAGGQGFVPLSPARIVNSSTGLGVADGLGAGETDSFSPLGVGGIPASGVSAVALNVQSGAPTADSYLTVWPDGETRPALSSLEFPAGVAVSQLVQVKLGANGRVAVRNSAGSTQLYVDVAGYYTGASDGAEFVPVTGTRIENTVTGLGSLTGTQLSGAANVRSFPVTGVGGVPAGGVSAVALTVQVGAPSATGYVNLWPAGETRPATSSVAFPAAVSTSGTVIAKVGAGGQVSVFLSAGDAQLYIDVAGYYQQAPTVSLLDTAGGSYLRPYPAADIGTATPTLHARYSDAQTSGRVDYQVYDNATGTLATSGSGTTVATGADSPWTVPTGALGADATYRWRARSFDGVAYSPWSTNRFFHTGAPATIGEERRYSFETRRLTDRTEVKVNVANGNLLLHAVDLTIKGTGIDLVVDRYYNSRSSATGPLGPGWTMGIGHDVKLAVRPDGSVRYTAPSGYTATFAKDGTAGYRHPPGLDATLTRDAGADTYTITFHSGAKYVFEAVTAGSSYRQKRIRDRNDNEIVLAYNGSGWLSQATDTQGRQVSFTYAGGELTTVTYPGATTGSTRTNTYTVNGSNGQRTVAIAGEPAAVYRYTGDLLDEVTTPAGVKVDFAYDTSRRATSVQHYDPGNSTSKSATTTFNYVSSTQTKVTDPNGSASTADSTDGITTYTHDDRDRVTKVVDALGHTRDDSYTSNDNVTTTADSLGKVSTMSWNPDTDNLESTQLATGAKTTLTYGAPGAAHAPDTVTDPEGRKGEYAYDTKGNLTQTKANPAGGAGLLLRQVDYNTNGTIDKITETHGDPGATSTVVTDYSYDTGNKNLTGVDNPAPLGDVTIVPDLSSRTKQTTDGKGQVTATSYDGADRVDTIDYAGGTPGAPEVDHDWDADGNPTKIVDPSGTTTLSYDKVNRNIRKRTTPQGTVDYDYDHTGNLTELDDPVGTTSYGYDQVNNLTTLTEPGSTTAVQFTYDNNNRRKSVTFPTSPAVTVNLGYDDAGRQTTITATRTGSATGGLLDLSYAYTKAGADTAIRQSKTEAGYGTETYGYDLMGRLTTVTGALSRTYSYDLASNRTKTIEGSTTWYDYGKANQLCASGATAPTGAENADGCQPTPTGGTTYSHDGNGNLTASTGGPNGGWALTYNTLNQTTALTHGGTLSPLTYAGTDQNQRLQAGGTSYLNTAIGVTQQTTGSTSVGFVRDNAGNLVSRVTNSGGTWTRHYYLLDGLGSVVGLVDSTGVKVNSYRYDPYGKPLLTTETVSQPWRYTGGYLDAATGLYKLGIRYYDPNLGRFTQTDPTGKGAHYVYASNNPTTRADPSGAIDVDCGFLGIACTVTFSQEETLALSLGAGAILAGVISGEVAAILTYLFAIAGPVTAVAAFGVLAIASVLAGAAVVPAAAGECLQINSLLQTSSSTC